MIGDITALYRFYDTDRQLLYIGISKDPFSRIQAHRATQPWWTDSLEMRIVHYPTRFAALTAEAAAIRTEAPLHNIQCREPSTTSRPSRLRPSGIESRLLTIREAAPHLGFCERQARRLIKDGTINIPLTMLGSRARIRRSDLERWLEDQTDVAS